MRRALAPLTASGWGNREVDTRPPPARKRSRVEPEPPQPLVAYAPRAPSLKTRAHHNDLLKAQISEDLSEFRIERDFNDGDIDLLKGAAQRWLDRYVDGAPNNLRSLLRNDVDDAQVKAALRHSIFDGLETKHQEMSFLEAGLDAVAPRRVSMADKSEVVSFDIYDLLVKRLQEDKAFRQQVITIPTVRKDVDDGIRMRWHPHLLRPATPEEEDDLRIALLPEADDLEVGAPSRPTPAPAVC
jgi:hypothetical protein